MTRKSEAEYRDDLIEVCKRIYAKGFVAASDGNVSIRLGQDRVLCTPSGFSKGYLKPEQLLIVNMAGEVVGSRSRAGLKPSSEILLHLECYRQRPEIGAVVHAHPPVAIACTIAGVSLAQCVIPEVIVTFGAIPTAPYATPGSPEGPNAVRELIANHDAILLDHHGTVTVGKDVFDAYFKLEKVEHAAEVTLAARQLGRVRGLPGPEVQKLLEIRRQMGRGEGPYCQQCDLCAILEQESQPRLRRRTRLRLSDDELVRLIAQEVLRMMSNSQLSTTSNR